MKRAFVLLLATVTMVACDGTNNKDKENSNLAREEVCIFLVTILQDVQKA